MKKTVKIILSLVLASIMQVSALASPSVIQIENAEEKVKADTEVSTSSPVLLQADEAKPGINIYTGTGEALSFEDATTESLTSFVRFETTTCEIKEYPETSNKALRLTQPAVSTSEKTYPKVRPLKDVVVEANRPIYCSMKTFVERGQSTVSSWPFYLMHTDVNSKYTKLEDMKGKNPFYTTDNSFPGLFDVTVEKSTIDTEIKTPFVETQIIRDLNTAVWIDDINIMPYYKADFYVDGELFDTNYFLTDSNGNIKTTYSPSEYTASEGKTLPTKDGLTFAGWSLDSSKNAKVTNSVSLENADLVFYAVWKYEAGLPGINIYTGTEEPVTFEGLTTQNVTTAVKIESADWTVEEYPNTSNTALKLTQPTVTGSTYPKVRPVNNPTAVSIEANRPLYYYTKVFVERGQSDTTKWPFYFMYTKAAGSTDKAYEISGEKEFYTTDGTFPCLYEKIKDGVSVGEVIYTPFIQTQIVRDKDTAVWIDDINVMPYYKATFHVGTEVYDTNYFLTDKDGKLMTSYNPDSYVPSDGKTVPTSQDGLVFVGWSETENGNVTHSVELSHADINLYAVYKSLSDFAPVTQNLSSIRVTKNSDGVDNSKSGIRFMSSLNMGFKACSAVSEYGFLAAITEKLGDNELTVDFTYDGIPQGKKPYVKGVCYNKAEGRDIYYNLDDENVFFTCVLSNIGEENYKTSFTVVPYIIADGSYVYGTPVSRSIGEVAKAIADDFVQKTENPDFDETSHDYYKNYDYLIRVLEVCYPDVYTDYIL